MPLSPLAVIVPEMLSEPHAMMIAPPPKPPAGPDEPPAPPPEPPRGAYVPLAEMELPNA